jgi:hypothetical protein
MNRRGQFLIDLPGVRTLLTRSPFVRIRIVDGVDRLPEIVVSHGQRVVADHAVGLPKNAVSAMPVRYCSGTTACEMSRPARGCPGTVLRLGAIGVIHAEAHVAEEAFQVRVADRRMALISSVMSGHRQILHGVVPTPAPGSVRNTES